MAPVRPGSGFKLLVVDLDGTLLRPDGTIHAGDEAAIKRLLGAGVPVSIVTGRLYSGTREFVHRVGAVGPVACVEGSVIVDARDDACLARMPIASEAAVRIRRVLDRYETAGFLLTDEQIVHDAVGAPYLVAMSAWSPNFSAVPDVRCHPGWEHEGGLLAVMAVGTRAEIGHAAETLRAELPPTISIVSFTMRRFGDRFVLMARASAASKGTALTWLAGYHGCAPDEVVAVGDWTNDIPMFQAAGRSFAMADSPRSVKEAATDRLEANVNRGGGIAEAIEQIWAL